MRSMVVCMVALATALTACAATVSGTKSLLSEPWNGRKQDLRWSERLEIEPATNRPALFVDLAIPVGRPGTYGFDAPCITPSNREWPCVATGLPPSFGDAPMAGMPFVRFEADTSLLGHVTLRFPGRELERMPRAGAWTFGLNLYRIVADSVLVGQLEGRRPVILRVTLARHSPDEFRGK